jgi:Cellulose binding domain
MKQRLVSRASLAKQPAAHRIAAYRMAAHRIAAYRIAAHRIAAHRIAAMMLGMLAVLGALSVPAGAALGTESLYAVTLPTGDTVPPSQPGAPVVTPTSPTAAGATTSGSTDNDGVAGYWMQRQVNGTWTDWVTSSYGGFFLRSLTGSTSYTVAVVAFDRTGNRSPRSEPVSFTTPPYQAAPGCKVQRQVTSPTSHILTVNVENHTAATVVTNWTVTFTMPAVQTVIATFSSTLSRNGDTAILGPAFNTAQIPPTATVMFGFYGNRPVGSPLPSGFTLASPATGPIACTATGPTG